MADSRADVVSSFTIVKGSMIEETYTIMRGWDFDRSCEETLGQMKATNSIGAKSTSWLGDVYKVLHRRFDPNGRDRNLAVLAQAGCSLEVWKPVLLWHMTRDEFLVRDFLNTWLYEQFTAGALHVRADEVMPYLRDLPSKGLVAEAWKETTLKRVASGLLRIGVDFGLLRGTMVREFTSYHLPDEAFLYVLHAMHARQPNAREVVQDPDWHMFLMSSSDVERELFRLHQFRRLHYEVAGSLAQLSLPCSSADDYVREMVA